MSSDNLLKDIFYIGGSYPDPHDVKKAFKSASDEDKQKLAKQIKEMGLTSNPMIEAQLRKYEQARATQK